jgi:hypothetical protein
MCVWGIGACTGADPDAGQAVEAVRALDGTPEAIDVLNDVAGLEGDVVPGLESLLTDPDARTRWAAVYVAALATDTADEANVLGPALTDQDVVVRIMAAGSLLTLGRAEAIPVLIDALSGDTILPYSDPPLPMADLARAGLEAYTGQVFADASGWEAWWEGAKDLVAWDGERYAAG